MSRESDIKRRIDSLKMSITAEKAKDEPRWDVIALWEDRIALLYHELEKMSSPGELLDPPPLQTVPSPGSGGTSPQERYEETVEVPQGEFKSPDPSPGWDWQPDQAALLPGDTPPWYVLAGVGLVALLFGLGGKR